MIELSHSDLGLSMGSCPFKNVVELFHVETSLRKLNKSRNNYVTANLIITSAMGP